MNTCSITVVRVSSYSSNVASVALISLLEGCMAPYDTLETQSLRVATRCGGDIQAQALYIYIYINMESKQPIGLFSCIHERTAVTLHILVRMCLVFLDLDKIEVFIHSNVGKNKI